LNISQTGYLHAQKIDMAQEGTSDRLAELATNLLAQPIEKRLGSLSTILHW